MCRLPGGLDADGAMVRFDDALGRRQPETGAARLGGEKWREHLAAHLGGDARTAIAERDAARAIAAFDGDLDRAASVHRLGAIHQQVEEDDLEELGIPVDRSCAAGDLDTDVPECRILAQQINGERRSADSRPRG